MKRLLSTLCALAFAGCTTTSTQFSQIPVNAPTAAQVAAAKADIRAFLESPTAQFATKQLIIIGGNYALASEKNQTKQDALRKRIQSIADPIALLANGNPLPPSDVAAILQGSGIGATSAQGQAAISVVNLAWAAVYPKLLTLNDASLWKTWVLILAEAAQSVGAPVDGPVQPAA